MKRASHSVPLRLCLAILPVLMLLAGTWAQGFASASQAMTVVICSDGAMKTITLDPEDAGHGPQDCRDCPACPLPLPLDLPQSADAAAPLAWHQAVSSWRVTVPLLSRRAAAPLSRGPPFQAPRFRA